MNKKLKEEVKEVEANETELLNKFAKDYKASAKKVIKLLNKKQKVDDEVIDCLRNSLQNLNVYNELSGNEQSEDLVISTFALVLRSYIESGLFSDELNMELVKECAKHKTMIGEDFNRMLSSVEGEYDLTQTIKFSKEEDYDHFIYETMMMVFAAKLAKVKGANKFEAMSLKKCFPDGSEQQKLFIKTAQNIIESGLEETINAMVEEALKIVPNMKDLN